jgi:hypothetical protein
MYMNHFDIEMKYYPEQTRLGNQSAFGFRAFNTIPSKDPENPEDKKDIFLETLD